MISLTPQALIAIHRLQVLAVVDGGGDSDGRSRSGGDRAGDTEARAGRGVLLSAGADGGVGGDGGRDLSSLADLKSEVALDNSGGGLLVNGDGDGAVVLCQLCSFTDISYPVKVRI